MSPGSAACRVAGTEEPTAEGEPESCTAFRCGRRSAFIDRAEGSWARRANADGRRASQELRWSSRAEGRRRHRKAGSARQCTLPGLLRLLWRHGIDIGPAKRQGLCEHASEARGLRPCRCKSKRASQKRRGTAEADEERAVAISSPGGRRARRANRFYTVSARRTDKCLINSTHASASYMAGCATLRPLC